VDNAGKLTDVCRRIRHALNAQGFPDVDHVELFGEPTRAGAQSRNFVLCPGDAYDRSPCGTGTSAKLACLAADDRLAAGSHGPGKHLGTTFAASYRWLDRASGKVGTDDPGHGVRECGYHAGARRARSILLGHRLR
jgi:proline racemase